MLVPLQLSELRHNQTITLLSDNTFIGYVIAQVEPADPVLGVMILIAIHDAGRTGCPPHAHMKFPLADLAAPLVPAGRAK